MPTLTRVDAPGLPADWLNAWLAAIGVTVLLPEVRLSWTDDVVPHAVFWTEHPDSFVISLATALPTTEFLSNSSIARTHPNAAFDFARNVHLPEFRERAAMERSSSGFLLTASVTDLTKDADNEQLQHGPFDPPAPKGETLFSRAYRCAEMLTDPINSVDQTLNGITHRVEANGLGFDCRRLSPGVQVGAKTSKTWVEPVVELLTLASLALFPVRGDGSNLVRQRGWRDRPSRSGAFVWCTWTEQLDRWAIDAALDLPTWGTRRWCSVPYKTSNASDTTRAYFSQNVP